MLSELIEFRRSFPLRQLEKEFKHYDVKICVETDENYPAMLKEIFDPPFVLYYRGELKAAEDGIGIVGARSCTPYGMQIAQSIASQLAKAGFTIVSGAAKGIDTNAHIGALKTGRTIAVLGCGLDIAYPQENKQLLLDIAKREQSSPNCRWVRRRRRAISLPAIALSRDCRGALWWWRLRKKRLAHNGGAGAQ